jgi:hypothetical protein
MEGIVQLLQLLLKVVLSPPVMPRPSPKVLCPHCGKQMDLLSICVKHMTALLC